MTLIVQCLAIGAVICAMFSMSGCGLGPSVDGSGIAKSYGGNPAQIEKRVTGSGNVRTL